MLPKGPVELGLQRQRHDHVSVFQSQCKAESVWQKGFAMHHQFSSVCETLRPPGSCRNRAGVKTDAETHVSPHLSLCCTFFSE